MKNNEINKKNKIITYIIKGMHCQSCEILIEKKISNISGILNVSANTGQGVVVIKYDKKPPSAAQLNDLFKDTKYTFYSSEKSGANNKNISHSNLNKFKKYINYLIFFLFIAVFLILLIDQNSFGFLRSLSISSDSSLFVFFLFGIVASLSTCAALVGGIILAMSRQWLDEFSKNDTLFEKAKPHIIFNIGRLISYSFFGALLGLIGSRIEISYRLSSLLTLGISLVMIAIGFQLIGLPFAKKFRLTLPKNFTKKIANEKNFNGRFMPAVLGALTFFLPCGFTIAAQGAALLSGSIFRGSLIMFLFALGTLPFLLLLGLTSASFFSREKFAKTFSIIAGMIIIFFAGVNINSQLNVLNLPSINDISIFRSNDSGSIKDSKIIKKFDENMAPVIDGKQILKMSASSSGYSPNHFKVRSGVPVRWEISDIGTNGCTSAVIAKGLFNGQIKLTHGEISIKEFTPILPGIYKFSCWMGMVTGTIEVIG